VEEHNVSSWNLQSTVIKNYYQHEFLLKIFRSIPQFIIGLCKEDLNERTQKT
jgi:hypothetical protein